MDRFLPSYDFVTLEIGFLSFYRVVIERELQPQYRIAAVCGTQRATAERNLQRLAAVRNAYCKYSLRNGVSSIRFDDPCTRSAYMFLNATCVGSSVARHFLGMLHSGLLGDALRRGTLEVCCLGGGPAAESLAIAKSLELFPGGQRPLRVHVTVVDVDGGWAETSRHVTQTWWKWIDPRVVSVKVSFVRADLTRDLHEVGEVLGKSDVVTMVKFVSAVYGTRGREKISEMLQEIVRRLRADCLLFFANCSRFTRDGELGGAILRSSDMRAVYGPYRDDVHCLSPTALRACFLMYRGLYGRLPPNSRCKNHVVAWRKTKEIPTKATAA